MSDKYAVIWTREGGAARKLADMTLTSSELRITKHDDAIADNVAGVSVLHDLLKVSTLVYPLANLRSLPAQLEALLPPNNPSNPQRIILSRLLSRTVETRGMTVLQREWELLMFAGRNASGHLDVFRSDDAAFQYYEKQSKLNNSPVDGSPLWAALKRIGDNRVDVAEDVDTIAELVGPTPGVSGFATKLLTTIVLKDEQWDGRIERNATGIQAVVKIESDTYPGLLLLEDLCYEMHERLGLTVPRRWLRRVSLGDEDFDVLATERFDRKIGLPVPMESVFTILRTGGPNKFYTTTDGSMETLWDALKLCSSNPIDDKINLFKRFVLSFLTGNGDLHLENWSILGKAGQARLSPVYDPAPMRAYRAHPYNHDLLSALPFNGIGGASDNGERLPYAISGNTPPDLRKHVMAFGKTIGISSTNAKKLIDEALELTNDYVERAADLMNSIPEAKRKPKAPDIDHFISIVSTLRTTISN